MLSEAKHLGLSSRTEPESSAVDVNGIRHRRSKYGDRIPWNADPIKFVEPGYPAESRARHAEGTGLFRVTVDVNTGGVTNVGVIKSTGYAALDDSAMRAIRLWRWRARRWKEIDTPLTLERKHASYHTGNAVAVTTRWQPLMLKRAFLRSRQIREAGAVGLFVTVQGTRRISEASVSVRATETVP
jgi:TonB family protein